MTRAGDGSTLSLDFTTGVLDPRFTFTRSTTATYINSEGYVTTMAAAPTNDPTKARFDYDPITLAPRGLLIEASAVNYVLQSGLNPFASPTWQTSGTTLPTIDVGYTGNGFAPDNTSRPTRVQFAVNSGSASRITQGTSYTTNPTTAAPYTVSVWMKSNTAGTNYTINILGTAGSSAVTVTPTWQRFTLVNTSGTSLVGYVYISNESGSVAADVLIWGAQLEAGNGASSTILTGASTATRAADFAVLSNLSAIAFNTAGGSMVLRGFQTKQSAGSFPSLAAFLDASDVDVFGIRNSFAGVTMFGRFAGTSTTAEALRTVTNNATYAIGMAADPTITTSAITVSMNGSSTTGNKIGSATAISTPAKFAITRPTFGDFINCGTISSIKYWPTVKTAAELNSLTTG